MRVGMTDAAALYDDAVDRGWVDGNYVELGLQIALNRLNCGVKKMHWGGEGAQFKVDANNNCLQPVCTQDFYREVYNFKQYGSLEELIK